MTNKKAKGARMANKKRFCRHQAIGIVAGILGKSVEEIIDMKKAMGLWTAPTIVYRPLLKEEK